MDLLHFDTETRNAIVQMTRSELLDLDSEFLNESKKWVSRTIKGNNGALEIIVVGD